MKIRFSPGQLEGEIPLPGLGPSRQRLLRRSSCPQLCPPSLAGPLGQPTMKFVMDTSKYWFKPSISRDRGEAVSTGQPRTQSSPEELGCHPTATRGGTPNALGGAGCGESQEGSGGLRTPLRAPKVQRKLPGPHVCFWHCWRASAGRTERGTGVPFCSAEPLLVL